MPEWLDNSFLTAALEDGNTNSPLPLVTVSSFTVTSLQLEVKNFTSILYKVEVKYKDETQQKKIAKLIVKDPISDGLWKTAAMREPLVYYKVLKNIFVKTGCYFAPKAFYSSRENVLIMENLKEVGYILTENAKQLDFDHSKLFFDTIAKFHAASIACHHDEPNLYDVIGLEVIYLDVGMMKPWVVNSVKGMIETADELDDKRFADFVRTKVDDIWEIAQNKYKPKPTGLNVLNHGDTHKKNLLFKYNKSGKVVDLKMVDYQNTRYGSPVLDLLYFMWTSADADVRENRQQELYGLYLQTFNKSLQDLGCEERLTKEALEEELLWGMDWALLNFCLSFPLVMSKPEEAEGISDLDKAEDFETMKFKKLFHGKLFRPLLKPAFRHFADFFLSGKKMVS